MRRIAVRPRENLEAKARETGFALLTIDGERYWDETAYYAFTLNEIERDLEEPSRELAALAVEVVERAIKDEQTLRRLCIPDHGWDLIAESWRRRDKSLYGRLDLAYNGIGPAKLLEYNADTPTALFEASVFQWLWLEDMIASGTLPTGSDQFNSIHETLVARLRLIRAGSGQKRLHLACMPDSIEDRGFIAYLADCANQAGFAPVTLGMADIGDRGAGPFLDLGQNEIALLFKLYPWEWMLADKFGRSAAMRITRFIEPAWKAVISNKGLLPLLWEHAPGHPNLLPAFFDDDPRWTSLGKRFAKKPLYSREGENVLLVAGENVIDRSGGTYGEGPFVFQGLAMLPEFAGNYPIIGSWIVGDAACGIGVREDESPITKNTSRFLPHAIHD